VDSEFESAKKLVEDVIRKIGLDPGACTASASEGQTAWTLKRGSASVLVTVTQPEEEKETTYLRVASPVVTLPVDRQLHGALLRRLLELNAGGLANAAFGLIGDRVVAVSERPAAGLDSGEVEQMVRHLAAVADTFDDRLSKEFGATKA
jgi:anti-sigma factor RsiW